MGVMVAGKAGGATVGVEEVGVGKQWEAIGNGLLKKGLEVGCGPITDAHRKRGMNDFERC